MADDFWEVAKIIKPEYMHMVVLVVTKMDQFQPEESHQSRDDVEQHICRIFANDHGIHDVVFSDRTIDKRGLFTQMYDAVKDKDPVHLDYTDAEFLQYFDLKAWKGREMHDLYRTKNLVQGIANSFIEGLSDLEKNRTGYSSDDWHDYIFSAIQQCHAELQEKVMNPFTKRNGSAQIEFDDYASFIELHKIVSSAQNEVRNEAIRLLPINPDDTSNWVSTAETILVISLHAVT